MIKKRLLKENPKAKRFIKPFVGASEFINGSKKMVLWINDEHLGRLQ
jgi:hypothetical protein